MEKLKQLSKYIEPLRRMINKIDKNEGGCPGEGEGPRSVAGQLITWCVSPQTGRRT